MENTVGFKYSEKFEFRKWIEVKIGANWYILSDYKLWRNILHLKYDSVTDVWVKDAGTNETVSGTIDDFAEDWTD